MGLGMKPLKGKRKDEKSELHCSVACLEEAPSSELHCSAACLTGPDWHAGLTDEQYQAQVDADIREHGYYRPDRDYTKTQAWAVKVPLRDAWRPDLSEDSAAWARLLASAIGGDDELYETLIRLRLSGARLTKDAQFGYRLERGEIEESAWTELRRRYLIPRATKLTTLLKNLS